ncbi:hypothetical protein [Flagellimonas sp. CMM7]|uniref:hypothetical protein n=1 Tax=Flagellimonas sp. CMM7 TaxID=2654676 RepID=UPI0013D701FC|nr:hypothetical protein [Flagellimonas sp. CMM7]UII80053.1 hypothetical protein LV704_00680 [Flagellimonas sp. CMM7]
MKKDTIHRLDEIREHNKLKSNDFERKLGYSNGAYAKAFKANASVKDDIIRKTLEVFPKVSLRWLVLGEGEMEGSDSNILVDPKNLSEEELIDIINVIDLNLDRFSENKYFKRIVTELQSKDFELKIQEQIKGLQEQIKLIGKKSL